MRLVLWDIDHTLIATRGVGRELSAVAFKKATGRDMREQAKIDGITEPVIFRETAKLHGLTTNRADFDRFAESLAELHRVRAAELRERGHALPGAAAALDALASLPDVLQTVVSGNLRPVSKIKLEVFGLDRHIDWEIGAFGEDREERPALVRLALERAAQKVGRLIPPDHAVLIGDTPADVDAGRENGVRVVAVASGRSSEKDLRDAGAETVVPDLRNTDLLLELVASI